MSDVEKIVKMLHGDAIEKQIAAAIVLGELHAKGPEVVAALSHALDSGIPLLQHHALDALAKAGAKKALPKIFPLLLSNDVNVKRSASLAITSCGEEVLPILKARMAGANPEERRALDGVLATLGGKEAFSALLAGLSSSEGEAAKQAALAVRALVKSADGHARRSYLAEIEKFLKPQKKDERPPEAIAAAVKILG
ncbi:MAG: HEAT repeat domain-containing protein, partial [Polyangiaceae bacterium]